MQEMLKQINYSVLNNQGTHLDSAHLSCRLVGMAT